jgi:hypothetical protein
MARSFFTFGVSMPGNANASWVTAFVNSELDTERPEVAEAVSKLIFARRVGSLTG